MPGVERSRRGGKRAVLVLLAATIAILAASAYVVRGYPLDSWLMWRLESSDWTTRLWAAEKLGERRCLRAIPGLLRLIAEEDDGGDFTLCVAYEPDMKTRYASPLIGALWNMGENALPGIESSAREILEDGQIGASHRHRIRFALRFVRDRELPMGRWEQWTIPPRGKWFLPP